MQAILALEDGKVFRGQSFGASGERYGEVVFNTSMTGYQEILTDPSYRGQIIVMTYPLIGNYGINLEDVESFKPFAEGLIVRECCKRPSSWRSQKTLAAYLEENNLLGIEEVDTRSLTLHIREAGAMKAVLSTSDLDPKRLVQKAKNSRGLVGVDLVKEVTRNEIYAWMRPKGKRYKVVVLDCGVKYNILRELLKNRCQAVVVPAHTGAEEILKLKPDGVLLSNGPGDPAAISYVIETTRKLIGRLPIFGICLGHQILGLALGGKTYKLKFGHHGANHPVKDLKTGKVYITVQNHGFCVDIDSLDHKEIEITHLNLNDQTLEGMRHRKLPVFSVQFHPEASSGPRDAGYLFAEFIKVMEKYA
ncbi:MAG: glutamine-hydrolyzing carbamoyl-phosphate synthase small subunit [Candidatus Omnitrophica bacterium]|nr:glutamine-hydrolyzing carbamoyl-phosphate synthase small subunit [Candidatus Omnitrophota bacterium]MDD5662555.1 glutamine-hydrolyzing carbamoyl-phosphate synthase small subunit [Candidatus Omnitrophota bacterium]